MSIAAYDFVVVGGGTAGLVVANRLSAITTQQVLVLETGADMLTDPRVTIPALYEGLMGTEADWGYVTETQEALFGRTIPISQGRALGGSSAINAQLLVPPSVGLIDDWATLGNTGWGWSSIKNYFRKAFNLPEIDTATAKKLGVDHWTPFQDANGPVPLSFPGDVNSPIRKLWTDTFKAQQGLMPGNPYTEATELAFNNLVSVDPKTKERTYANPSYYQPIKSRSNLKVLTGATVDKINFQTTGGTTKAVGVDYTVNGAKVTVTARKEVILAAGALNSPKVLELSGVGDAALLNSLGITVVKDLPGVGENLQDHLVSGISFEANDNVETVDAIARGDPGALDAALLEYQTNRTGLLTSVGIGSYAYLPVANYLTTQGQADLKKLLDTNRPAASLPNTPANNRAKAYYAIAEKRLKDASQPSACFFVVPVQQVLPVKAGSSSPAGPSPGKWLTFGVFQSHPLSRGSVHIRSKNVADAPKLNPRYLTNPVDLDVFANHMMLIRKIAEASPLSTLFKQPLRLRDPASDLKTLDAARNYIKQSSVTMRHPGSTCSMLPLDKDGVVDTQLRVYGINNLRIVDSSIMPWVSTGNLQQTVYAVAEKAADMIKATYGLK